MIDLTTVPRILAKLEYTAVRLPIACLDEYVLALYWAEDAPPRSDVRHFLGSLDEVAGWLLADDEIARRGETLLRQTRTPGPSGAPGAGAPPTGTPAAGEPPTGEPPAGEPTRAAPPEAWSAGEVTDATTAAAGPVVPDRAREDAADQPPENTADQPPENTADQPPENTADQPPENTADQPPENTADQPPENTADQPPENTADQPPENTADQPPENTADQPPENTADQPPENTADQPPENTADQPPENTADQPPENTADQPPENTADQAQEDTSVTAASAVDVAFSLPADVDADSVALCGDFNDWSAEATVLKRGDDGTWQVSVPLEPGRSYRYRYLLDGERWENGQADRYEPNPYGDVDSVIVVE